jgi:predicted histidine transporter YuiF (NhaC family)
MTSLTPKMGASTSRAIEELAVPLAIHWTLRPQNTTTGLVGAAISSGERAGPTLPGGRGDHEGRFQDGDEHHVADEQVPDGVLRSEQPTDEREERDLREHAG